MPKSSTTGSGIDPRRRHRITLGRLVPIEFSSLCGGRSFRFIAVGPCAHIHTLVNHSRKVERGSVLRRDARALLKSKRRGRKKGEGIKEKKRKRKRERMTWRIYTVNFVASRSHGTRGTASCILFISLAKRGCYDRFKRALRPRRACSSKLYKTRLHASAMSLSFSVREYILFYVRIVLEYIRVRD